MPSSNYRKSSQRGRSKPASARKPAKQTARAKKPTTRKPKPPGRQQEILGILTIALSLLWLLAVVTYNPADNAQISGRSFWQLFIREEGSLVTNNLGPVGAYLAQATVPGLFGYLSALLCGLLVVLGYTVLRKRPIMPLRKPFVITIVAMGYLATLVARVAIDVNGSVDPAVIDSVLWTGSLGTAAGAWIDSVLGPIGSYVVLATVLIAGLLLVMNWDLQRVLDGVESLTKKLISGFRTPPDASEEYKRGATPWEKLPGGEPEQDEAAKDPTEAPPAATPEAEGASATAGSADDAEAQRNDPELKVYGPVQEEKSRDGRHAAAVGGAPPYKFPPIKLLDRPKEGEYEIDFDELEENKRILLDKLEVYNIEITDINAIVGPTVTLYELAPAPGVKISRIKALEDDLAMAMAARGIRMIAPIPGKSAVGVEIPNRKREIVRLEQIIGTKKFADAQMELPIALGKTIEGEVFLEDLTKMPHLLIAGATGSGKSVGLNAIVAGLLYATHPANIKFVMVDPKKIELQQYRGLWNHCLAAPEGGDEAIITEVLDALSILKACELEMENRYTLLSGAGVRGVKDYNEAFSKGGLDPSKGHKHLPYIVVIVDELADLMMTAGKDIEAPIARLAQMSRAVGIHLVLATQRPSVDVITGLIKANFPSRVAFQVASKIDARTILDQNGAEQLVGNGDMLYMSGSRLIRLQGPYVSVQETDRLVAFIQKQEGAGPYRLPAVEDPPMSGLATSAAKVNGGADALLEESARILVRAQKGSVSLLQRKLSIGYTRAARIVDELERIGIVGPYQGSKVREVLVAR